MVRDISENVMSEVKGLEAQHTGSTVILKSADGEVLYMSKQNAVEDGYEAEEKVGKTFRNFIHPQDLDVVYRAMQEALIGDNAPEMRIRVLTHSGDYKHVKSVTRRLVDSETGEFYVVHVATRADS
jgi:PAS domain S-box-containing protein